MSIKVRWEVDDGYCGGSRPQTFTVDPSDFEDDMDEREIGDRLAEIVQDEFLQRISWFIKNESEVIEAVKAALAARENERGS